MFHLRGLVLRSARRKCRIKGQKIKIGREEEVEVMVCEGGDLLSAVLLLLLLLLLLALGLALSAGCLLWVGLEHAPQLPGPLIRGM